MGWNPLGMEDDCSLAPSSVDKFSSAAIIGLSLGDADLDGYPDLAVGLKCNRIPGIFPAILRNLAGTGGNVRFQAYLLPGVESNATLKQIAFYDYNEDVSFIHIVHCEVHGKKSVPANGSCFAFNSRVFWIYMFPMKAKGKSVLLFICRSLRRKRTS